ncbi:hypothetical protein ACHAWF_012995 [Thalassiosira exigua]
MPMPHSSVLAVVVLLLLAAEVRSFRSASPVAFVGSLVGRSGRSPSWGRANPRVTVASAARESVEPTVGPTATEEATPATAAASTATGKAPVASSRSDDRIGEEVAMGRAERKESDVLRWILRGVAAELFHNVVVRTLGRIRSRLLPTKDQGIDFLNEPKYRLPRRGELAVVTGATGGIGSEMVHELAFRGYDVVVAARNVERGRELARRVEGLLKVTPTKEGEQLGNQSVPGGGGDDPPAVTFVEYHADDPLSATHAASSIEGLEVPLKVLINNAGIMGKSKRKTMEVNLVGPALLTLALLPVMKNTKEDEEERATPPTVVNVGSSAHLRATYVVEEESPSKDRSWIKSLTNDPDDDLTIYARSKLALMQFSTLLRRGLSRKSDGGFGVRVYDAHPGLVWTPLLRDHIGDKAVATLTKTGLAGLIYKSPSEGAQAILGALDYALDPTETTSLGEQVYFTNGRPGGYAAPESVDSEECRRLWDRAIAPEVEGVVEMPKGRDLGSLER